MEKETLLLRRDAAKALSAVGYPVKAATLAKLACRGGGPKFRRFGRTPLYRWADLLEWAEAKSSPVGTTTTECETLRSAAAA